MIDKLKKWLAYGTVNSKLNMFKFAILGELILLIITVICLCSIISLKKENKQLKEQLNAQVEYIDTIHADVLKPLGL
jgi:hypothetical protein